ncbi:MULTISPECIES: intersectin-EH binding protein Ibp1 [Mycobacterium]|uniref:Intersectin-EH binding protein Ibp1 n=1 Tax=Mycobacterium syngnathidarum TaxID=1908205 RepID=A0A1Q9W736_9MYCO|nr:MULTISPECIES: intersectin-EH binding protein Ibp1 [Mycobacterium]MCG7608189.1 intersectin-EH binding protein Ibp1 [Mycobacterium sp. CnD-18-1]OHT93397.1 intersectin-EH binding protein Ibp1 [Mycobacterium syngnathidarum]OLT93163.1 intersectin-EH binding protein Ibp1 [Mycobacterium syngnathidarum]
MAITPLLARRFAVAAGLAAAIASAPAAAVLIAPIPPAQAEASCPNGETADTYTGVCVPYLVPNSPEFSSAPNQLPQIDGIPCTGGNSGQCIGLAEEQQTQGPQPVPQSTVGSSPTATGHIG